VNNDITLNRKILKWGWYKDSITKDVFIHLLLNANWHSGEHLGQPLLRGQCIFGRKIFSKELGISEQSIRTAINHLKSTNEITIKSTNKFSVITIVNYNVYQSSKNECEQTMNPQIMNEKSTNKSTNKNHELNGLCTALNEDENINSNQQSNFPLTNNQPATNHIQEGNNYVVSSNEDTCPNKSPDAQKIFEHESIPYRLAIKLSKVIHDERVNPTAKKQDEQQLQKWALTFDRMIRLDKREPKDINNVFEYALFGDPFWRTNMLSAEAVRKHYDRVYPLMIKDRSG
jgi:biotin operon repressor